MLVVRTVQLFKYTHHQVLLSVADAGSQPGLLWRVTSGVYSTATGAVGAGIGGVRWVASKTYDVSSAVVSKVPVPSLSLRKKKDKNE